MYIKLQLQITNSPLVVVWAVSAACCRGGYSDNGREAGGELTASGQGKPKERASLEDVTRQQL